MDGATTDFCGPFGFGGLGRSDAEQHRAAVQTSLALKPDPYAPGYERCASCKREMQTDRFGRGVGTKWVMSRIGGHSELPPFVCPSCAEKAVAA